MASILVILTVFALPAITPSVESRKTREAARMLNVMFGSARARAMETNRPVGVLFQRNANVKQAVLTLFVAEVPPPYGGDFTESRIRITNPSGWSATVQFPLSDDYASAGVKAGDQLQLNYQGHTWTITAMSGSNWTFSSMTALGAPMATSTVGVPFTIYRQPVPSSTTPQQLPRGVVVDLGWSGVGTVNQTRAKGFAIDDANALPVMVMFSPRGEVDGIYASNGTNLEYSRVSEPLYFLIGQRQRIPSTLGGASPAEDGLLNYQDLGNLWVVVNPQTGLIKTVNVAASSGAFWSGTTVPSRNIARESQSMGGK